jgi:asparagine synthetase B (glutamine-hydrolysing)
MDKTIDDIEKLSHEHLRRIYPKDTHMDFNISAVLYTACEMKGISDIDGLPLTSSSRVVLSGLGADEIFSGYSRYRVAYNRGGFQELEREMNFDLERLWVRNLGRDDRATSDRAK